MYEERMAKRAELFDARNDAVRANDKRGKAWLKSNGRTFKPSGTLKKHLEGEKRVLGECLVNHSRHLYMMQLLAAIFIYAEGRHLNDELTKMLYYSMLKEQLADLCIEPFLLELNVQGDITRFFERYLEMITMLFLVGNKPKIVQAAAYFTCAQLLHMINKRLMLDIRLDCTVLLSMSCS